MTAPSLSLHRVLLTTAFLFGAWLALASAPALAKTTHPLISSFDGSDAPGGPFGFVTLADAVDNSTGPSAGDVYVGALDQNLNTVVDKFDSSGAYAGVQIDGTGTPSGTFSLLNFDTFANAGIAVDSSASASSGDLYVADAANGVVDRFDPSGAFVCQITGAGSAATDLAHECDGADPGAPAGSLSPTGIAVSASGDLFVADAANNVVDHFDPSGKYLGQISDPHITQAGALALDSAGNLYLFNGGAFAGGGDVLKFDSGGAFVSVFVAGVATGVSVDPTNDHVLVDEADSSSGQGQIAEFDASGTPVTTFAGPAAYATAAVSKATGDIYAPSIFGSKIEVYGPLIVIPDVTTGSATTVDQTTATLNGHVDPDAAHGGGDVTDCHFSYTDDASFQANGYSGAQSAPCTPATPISSPADVSADISGLTPDTTYHFRLDANNANGFVNQGQDQAFTTRGPPVIDSQSSTAATTTATLRAQINPFGLDTTCQVQYVDDAGFQSSGYAGAATLPCTPADLGSAFGDQSAEVSLTGLQVATTYHFRFLATNQADTATGADQTFATFGVKSFSLAALDQNGQPVTQAGSHPWELTTRFDLNTTTSTGGSGGVAANIKDVLTDLPPGLVGDVTAPPRCTSYELTTDKCSPSAQLGDLAIRYRGGNFLAPLYNLVPPAGNPAQFGAIVAAQFPVYLSARVRTGGDYGITALATNVTSALGVTGVTATFWGVPADPSHDAQRFCPGNVTPCPSAAPLRPFLTMPTSCSGPQTASLRINSWQDPGDFVSAASTLPANTGCDRLDFTPSLTVQPDTGSADSSAGLHVDLHVPQAGLQNPTGFAAANLKKAVVTLPAGTSVNPSAADGLDACSPAQIALQSPDPATCPDASKVGTVEVDTPLLDHPITGGVFVAKQNDNPFGSLLAIYIAVDDPQTGIVVKLAGHVVPDPQTGQLETTFDNNPQLPFSDFKLDFFGGPRAALATPQTCGTYQTQSQLTPWSDPNTATPATPGDSFQIASGPGGAPCPDLTDPSKFTPGFSAGTVTPLAGAYSPLVGKASRQDGSQLIRGLNLDLPPGLTGKLAGVATCPDSALAAAASNAGAAELANPSCPDASKLGTVNVGAGAGGTPFHVQGKVYLSGPYKGAPISVAVITPALAGPFDLGTVVVRAAAQIDPTTAQIHIQSDQLPSILQGIPLHIRSVAIAANRDQFTLNPTNCNPMSLDGTIFGSPTATAVSNRFQVAGCGSLGFKPSLKLHLKGGTKRNGHPAFTSVLTYPTGAYSNLAKVQVTLPPTMQLDQSHIRAPCTRPQFAANQCPDSSLIGSATAATPLLDTPLTGPVYLLTNGHALPDLMVDLKGPASQPIEVHLDGVVDTVHARLRTTFATVPDAPVSSAVISLVGASKGLLVNNTNLCAQKDIATVNLVAQDGDFIHHSNPTVSVPCAKAHKHHKRQHRRAVRRTHRASR